MRQALVSVARKELRDGWRDRRSLFAALLYPLLGPLVVGLALAGLARSRESAGPLRLAMAGASRAPSLVAYLEQRDVIVGPAPEDALAAVRAGTLGQVLLVPESYPRDFRASRPARLELLYDASRADSAASLRRVRALLEAYSHEAEELRLLARGVSPRSTRALTLLERDVATAGSRAGFALATLPIFLLTAAFVASMGLSIDATAGERERASLERLLLGSASPLALAAGKWLACAVPGLAGTVLTVCVVERVLRAEGVQALDLRLGLDPHQLLPLLGLLGPLALLAPAVQMLLALFARSYKEAQTQLSLLLFVPMLPGFLFAFGAARPAGWMRFAPVLGQQVLMGELLRGERLSPTTLLGLGSLTLLLSLLAVGSMARLLRSERIVFGR